MPNYKNLNIPVASGNLKPFDLPSDHVTTSNFMQLQPIYYRHLMPRQSVTIDASYFARMEPLAVPTFGRARINLRAFFVPYRLCMPSYNDFKSDTIHNNTNGSNLISKSVYFKNSTMIDYLCDSSISSTVSSGENFSYVDRDLATTVKKKFTTKGRQVWKILQSLGYNFDFKNPVDSEEFNALALLAYARVYFDWYSVSQYAAVDNYAALEILFSHDDPSTPYALTVNDFKNLFDFTCFVAYDADYFVSAWDNPNTPSSSIHSSFVIKDINNDLQNNYVGQVVSTSMTTDPMAQTTDSINTRSQLSQYLLTSLNALTSYLKRKQLSGARTIDRWLASYGLQLDIERLNRSSYIGFKSLDMEIASVTSTADTSSGSSGVSNLADYAGAGVVRTNQPIRFEYQNSNEYGVLIIMQSIVPSGGYFQGIDRHNLALTKLDFFEPEFDGLGVQAISKSELYLPTHPFYDNDDSRNNKVHSDAVFGYTGRYGHYKVPHSWVTGDFSLNTGADSWHLFRQFDDSSFNNDPQDVVHGVGFCLGSDALQYNRIFNVEDDGNDKFNVVAHFEVSSQQPCRKLFDTFDFDHSNGKTLTMQSNGTSVN